MVRTIESMIDSSHFIFARDRASNGPQLSVERVMKSTAQERKRATCCWKIVDARENGVGYPFETLPMMMPF